ncbi:MAG: NAD-dependent epimerase/dehydratase family protein [Anaerolineales bacterium]|nr:NAD-dependent epimerase/dehydratase family protein [Anaerolineales bacterium]
MNFLVTGAAGFLGAALANRLAQAGHAVRGLDDLSAGDPARLLPHVLFTRGDVNDRPKLWTLLQGVECVYHLAARVSVAESVLYPREYNAVNVGGTVSLMEAMRDVGVKRVVLVSSGAVYGEQAEQPLREDRPPDPRSPYAVSKLAAEYYVRTIGALWGIETVALRVFNAYGPGQPLPAAHAPVIPRFIRQALTGGSLVVHGDGRQTRDYVYLDDVLDALTTAATAQAVDRLVINVGSGHAASVRELVDAVREVTGQPLDVIYSQSDSAGVSRMRADLTLAGQTLGFHPRTSLTEGLRLTIDRDPRFAAILLGKA